MNRNSDTCFVAEDNSQIIGVIFSGNAGRRGYIYHIAVPPSHQHKEVATKLLNKTLAALNEIGIIKVALVVFEQNKDGNSF